MPTERNCRWAPVKCYIASVSSSQQACSTHLASESASCTDGRPDASRCESREPLSQWEASSSFGRRFRGNQREGVLPTLHFLLVDTRCHAERCASRACPPGEHRLRTVRRWVNSSFRYA